MKEDIAVYKNLEGLGVSRPKSREIRELREFFAPSLFSLGSAKTFQIFVWKENSMISFICPSRARQLAIPNELFTAQNRPKLVRIRPP